MKKRLVSAALAMCTVTALCACSQKEEEDIFTERWQNGSLIRTTWI